MTMIGKMMAGALALGAAGAALAENYTVYVRPRTGDAKYEAEMGKGNGTKAKPYYAIQLALADVAKNGGGRAGEIVLMPGVYRVNSTLNLGALGGGKEPGIIRSDASGRAVLKDGRNVPAAAFKPVEDGAVAARLAPGAAGKVLVADLGKLGIEVPRSRPEREFDAPLPLPDVFVDGKRFYPAKWPNEGWATVGEIVDRGEPAVAGKTKGKGITFKYGEENPSRWTGAPYVWLIGYWAYDWNQTVIPVKNIDPEQREISLLVAHKYGVPKKNDNATPRRWRAQHLLEELDIPGEFYLDSDAKLLYIMPNADWDGEKSEVSVSSEWRSLIFAKGASNILVQNLTLQYSYGVMANFIDCSNICVQGCTIAYGRDAGLVYNNCVNSRVADCDFIGMGSTALRAYGGNRKLLIPGGLVIENNLVKDCSQLAMNSLAVDAGGVGTIVRGNTIENVPHIALRLGGNDNIVEYNVFRKCCWSTDDASAIYKGRDPSCTGNIFRWNFFDEVGSRHASNLGTSAIYFDDGDSGDEVYGCIFRKCGNVYTGRDGKKYSMGAVFSHWGFKVDVDNCIFLDCGSAVASAPCNDAHWLKTIKSMEAKLRRTVDVEGDLYTAHYPWIKGLTNPQPGMDRSNFVNKCAFVNCELPPRGAWKVDARSAAIEGDPGFVDAAAGDFSLKPDSAIYRKIPGFAEIPFGKIGARRAAK